MTKVLGVPKWLWHWEYCFRFSGPVPPCRVWRYSPGKIPANLVHRCIMLKWQKYKRRAFHKISKKLSMFKRSARQLQAAWTVCKVHRWIFASESSRHQGHFSDDMCWTFVETLLHMMTEKFISNDLRLNNSYFSCSSPLHTFLTLKVNV